MPSTDEEPSEITELVETLWVLRDYLGEMTLIGGWVPELYRRYGDVDTWRSQLSRTREADILVPLTVPRGPGTPSPTYCGARGSDHFTTSESRRSGYRIPVGVRSSSS